MKNQTKIILGMLIVIILIVIISIVFVLKTKNNNNIENNTSAQQSTNNQSMEKNTNSSESNEFKIPSIIINNTKYTIPFKVRDLKTGKIIEDDLKELYKSGETIGYNLVKDSRK